MSVVIKPLKPVANICKLILVVCSVVGICFAQSTDINFPSPVRTNEVVGSITARDLGDARRTDHFYAFVGNPGDMLITIQSTNLNGDVDVFTAGNLRPLMKFTLYAESSMPVTKSVYLRRRQDLVLRVQARTPNDDEGIYQIRFGGSFEPSSAESLLAANENPAPDITGEPSSRDRNTKRVSSVGARIPEPAPTPVEEIATATPTPEPSAESTPAETRAATENPAATTTPEARAESPTRRATPRRTRSKGPARRRAPATRPAPAPKDETVAANETETKTEQPQEPEPLTGPRLIIEMQDGTRIERYMSTVKRVTVENNQIVVVNKLGRIERVRLSDVARMTIEP